MPILKIVLDVDERNALGQLAEVEKRDPRAQAAFIIRQQLEKLGLLSETAGWENTQGDNNEFNKS